jgi:hypothetical protein
MMIITIGNGADGDNGDNYDGISIINYNERYYKNHTP